MNRRILAVVLALALAALGTTGVLFYVNTAESRVAAGQQPTDVLIVKDRIPTGTSGAQIRESQLVEKVKMPAGSVPAGALTAIGDELDQLVVTSDVQASQLLLRGHFASSKRVTGGIALPKGTVAVSISADIAAEVAGFVVPGADVAVFDTYTERVGKSRVAAGDGLSRDHAANQVTRLLLPRVEVVATGQRGSGGQTSSAAADTDGEAASSSTAKQRNDSVLITVAVAQKDAEKLIHGMQTGALYLALLSDTSKVAPGNGVDNYSLFK